MGGDQFPYLQTITHMAHRNMASYDDFQRTVDNFEVADGLQEPPVLTDEQANFSYVIITPELAQLQLNEATGKELLEYAEALKAKDGINFVRIINSIYRFLTTSEIGDYCWLGYMQPVIFKAKPKEGFKTIALSM